jgi:hypothetical protein
LVVVGDHGTGVKTFPVNSTAFWNESSLKEKGFFSFFFFEKQKTGKERAKERVFFQLTLVACVVSSETWAQKFGSESLENRASRFSSSSGRLASKDSVSLRPARQTRREGEGEEEVEEQRGRPSRRRQQLPTSGFGAVAEERRICLASPALARVRAICAARIDDLEEEEARAEEEPAVRVEERESMAS